MRGRSTAVALALLVRPDRSRPARPTGRARGPGRGARRGDRSRAEPGSTGTSPGPPPDTPRADSLRCDLTGYKGAPGLTAALVGDVLTLTWDGDKNQQGRLRLTNNGGTPTIQDLAVRRKGGTWGTLASNVTPEFRVVSGRRRMDTEAQEGLRENGITEITPEVFEKNQWDPFWDAPLNIPGTADMGRTIGLPRKPEEVRRPRIERRAAMSKPTGRVFR